MVFHNGKTERKVILASASPRRKELLSYIISDFEIIPAKGEENAETGLVPSALVESLAKVKADEVYSRVTLPDSNEFIDENALVIGADTIVACDGEILGKPVDDEDAYRMLSLLSGREHEVFTGVCLKWNGECDVFHAMTKVRVAVLTPAEIAAYIATGEPSDKAGAYGIQGLFMKHVEGITGDYNNVVGLPVSLIYNRLKTNDLI